MSKYIRTHQATAYTSFLILKAICVFWITGMGHKRIACISGNGYTMYGNTTDRFQINEHRSNKYCRCNISQYRRL